MVAAIDKERVTKMYREFCQKSIQEALNKVKALVFPDNHKQKLQNMAFDQEFIEVVDRLYKSVTAFEKRLNNDITDENCTGEQATFARRCAAEYGVLFLRVFEVGPGTDDRRALIKAFFKVSKNATLSRSSKAAIIGTSTFLTLVGIGVAAFFLGAVIAVVVALPMAGLVVGVGVGLLSYGLLKSKHEHETRSRDLCDALNAFVSSGKVESYIDFTHRCAIEKLTADATAQRATVIRGRSNSLTSGSTARDKLSRFAASVSNTVKAIASSSSRVEVKSNESIVSPGNTANRGNNQRGFFDGMRGNNNGGQASLRYAVDGQGEKALDRAYGK